MTRSTATRGTRSWCQTRWRLRSEGARLPPWAFHAHAFRQPVHLLRQQAQRAVLQGNCADGVGPPIGVGEEVGHAPPGQQPAQKLFGEKNESASVSS